MNDNLSVIQKEPNFYDITQYHLTTRYPVLPNTLGIYISADRVFTDTECDDIIKIGYSKKFSYQQTTAKIVDKKAFNSKICSIEPGEEESIDNVYKRLRGLVAYYNSIMWNYNIYDFGEPIKFTEYSGEENGSTGIHSDLGEGITTYRKLTVIVQLSNEESYEGGELMVQKENKLVGVTKERGTVIVFPSFLMHCVKPVTKGVRNSLVLFVYGPPFS